METVSGSVYARGSFRAVDADSTSGAVSLAGALGEVDFSSVSGGLRLTPEEPFRLDAETTSGSVGLQLPEDMGLTLDFDSTSGEIQAGNLPITGQKGHLVLGDGASYARLSTVSGDLFFD